MKINKNFSGLVDIFSASFSKLVAFVECRNGFCVCVYFYLKIIRIFAF